MRNKIICFVCRLTHAAICLRNIPRHSQKCAQTDSIRFMQLKYIQPKKCRKNFTRQSNFFSLSHSICFTLKISLFNMRSQTMKSENKLASIKAKPLRNLSWAHKSHVQDNYTFWSEYYNVTSQLMYNTYIAWTDVRAFRCNHMNVICVVSLLSRNLKITIQ